MSRRPELEDGFLGADREQQRAVKLAYRSISQRERTVAEVRSFLERKEIEEGPREYALDELIDAGALDDARFARLFAEDRRSIDAWGGKRIERELERRGVGREHIAAALAGQDRDDELDAAVALLAAKVAPPADDRERDKAWRMLVRKGYEPELAYDAVRRHQAA